MNQFLDYIERYKFAILGTVLFHVLFFMTTNFATVARPYELGMVQEPQEIALETDEIELDEEMLEMLNKQNELNNEQLYNLTADQNDKRDRSFENYSSQDLDKQVEEEARALEQQYFDEWAATHPDSEGPPKRSDVSDDQNDIKKEGGEKPNPNELAGSGENAFEGKVMVAFNLPGRNAHSLKIPGYTCNGSGTVVITIKVDKSGDVKSASYNSALSRGATACMIEKAERYARNARFNYDADGGADEGTITYTFQGQ